MNSDALVFFSVSGALGEGGRGIDSSYETSISFSTILFGILKDLGC